MTEDELYDLIHGVFQKFIALLTDDENLLQEFSAELHTLYQHLLSKGATPEQATQQVRKFFIAYLNDHPDEKVRFKASPWLLEFADEKNIEIVNGAPKPTIEQSTKLMNEAESMLNNMLFKHDHRN